MTSIPLDELFSTPAVINDCYPKSLNTFTSRGKKKRIHKFDDYFVGKTQIIRYNEIKKKELKSGPLIFSLLVDERVIVMFRYNVRGENIEVTEAIRDYVEKKVGKLERYFSDSPEATVHEFESVH